MKKKWFKISAAAVLGFGLLFPLGQQASAQKIAGKCTIAIDANKHTSFQKAAKATGKCNKLVSGYYAAGNYHVQGGMDGTVVNGEKYLISVPPHFGKFEVTVKTIGKKAAIKAPSVNSVKSSHTAVKGKTVANANVTLKVGKKTIGSGKSNKNGNFNVKIKKQKAGTKIKVTAIKGSSSNSKSIKVKK